MSTSPSWFDQEKFSRLVKKVGTTTRSVGAPSTPSLPASSPSAASSTGPVQLPPEPSPATPAPVAPTAATEVPAAPEAVAPPPPAPGTPARPPASAIPKPSASSPLFSFRSASPAAVAPKTAPAPVAKAPEPAPEPAPEEAPEPPPAPAPPPPLARVFLTPPPAEVSEPEPEPPPPEPEPEPEPEPPKKPKFTFEIPKSELPDKPLTPEPPAEKPESASDFHIAEPPHLAKKASLTATSTLQRLPRIMPGGSKPPAAPTQTRAVSALSRRTTTLPGVKPLSAPLQPVERTEAPIRVSDAPAATAAMPPVESEFKAPKAPTTRLVAPPKQTRALPPPLTRATAAPPESFQTWDSSTVPPDEIASYKEQIIQLNQERDEALLEATTLRSQLAAAQAAGQEHAAGADQSHEIALVTGERDAARRDYAELRQQYETLKQDQVRLKNEHAAAIAGLRKELESSGAAAGRDDVIETLKQELKSLHEEVSKAKDEASTAQRGLALSQKALQETRDALREASDGKGALENIKKERSTLVQQNMLLQAQNDQVSRELSALKAKGSR